MKRVLLFLLFVSVSFMMVGCGAKQARMEEAAEELARRRAIWEARQQFENATYKKLPPLYAEVTDEGKVAAFYTGELSVGEIERITKRRRLIRLNDLAPWWDTRDVICAVCVGEKAMKVKREIDEGWPGVGGTVHLFV